MKESQGVTTVNAKRQAARSGVVQEEEELKMCQRRRSTLVTLGEAGSEGDF